VCVSVCARAFERASERNACARAFMRVFEYMCVRGRVLCACLRVRVQVRV
jgi:hypothetical protein